MASEWSTKNQKLSYCGKFQWIFDEGRGNLVWGSGEFELSEFEITAYIWLNSGVKSKGNGLSSSYREVRVIWVGVIRVQLYLDLTVYAEWHIVASFPQNCLTTNEPLHSPFNALIVISKKRPLWSCHLGTFFYFLLWVWHRFWKGCLLPEYLQ